MKNKQTIVIKFIALFSVLLVVGMLFFIVFMDEVFNCFKPNITKKYDERYVTDGQYVYYHDSGYQKVEGAAPATFCSLGDETADGKKIYGNNSFIAGKDKNNVFIKTSKVTKLNPAKVDLLGYGYVADGTNIYFEDMLIENADINSFEIILVYYAKDKNNLYYKGIPLNNSDANSWQFVYDEA